MTFRPFYTKFSVQPHESNELGVSDESQAENQVATVADQTTSFWRRASCALLPPLKMVEQIP